MAIELLRFASGDTDYVAKMNSDMAMIEAAINGLQLATSGSGNAEFSAASYWNAIFEGVTGLIGYGSYLPTEGDGGSPPNLSILTVAAGAAYKATTGTVVQMLISTPLDFTGVGAGTYYIVPDAAGNPTRSTSSTDALYSVVWNGSAFGTITKIAKTLWDIGEAEAARSSATTGAYDTLDDRLEAMEAATVTAQETAASALATVARVRKIGLSLDGGGSVIASGLSDAIQVDFNGIIIGWSVCADTAGTLEVEVGVATQSPDVGEPPAPPLIPVFPDDKISASAPIALEGPSGAQSAAGGYDEVSTWSTVIQQWDSLRFKVVSATVITKATLYVRVQET